MSIEDIEMVIVQIEKWKAQEEGHRSQMPDQHQFPQQPNTRHFYEYQEVKNKIFEKVRKTWIIKYPQEIEEYRRKEHDSQCKLQTTIQQLQSKTQENSLLQEKLTHLQQNYEELQLQNTSLLLQLAQKDKQNQSKEENVDQVMKKLAQQNQLLHQQLETTYLTNKNLQIIADNEKSKRQSLQSDIWQMKREEKEQARKIEKLRQDLQGQKVRNKLLLRQMEEKKKRIQQLELIDKQSMNNTEDPLNQDKGKEDSNTLVFKQEQMDERKEQLVKLSQHIHFDEKEYLHLYIDQLIANNHERKESNHSIPNSLDHKEQSKEPQEPINKPIIKRQLTLSTPFVIFIQHPMASPIKNDKISKEKQEEKLENSLLMQIHDRAENRLKDYYSPNNKMIMQTQGTQTEIGLDTSILNEADGKISQKGSFVIDPYFIHYTLMVQSLKIEEDEEGIYGILQLDMRPYYNQLVASKLSLLKWNEWIRHKLFQVYNQNGFHQVVQ